MSLISMICGLWSTSSHRRADGGVFMCHSKLLPIKETRKGIIFELLNIYFFFTERSSYAVSCIHLFCHGRWESYFCVSLLCSFMTIQSDKAHFFLRDHQGHGGVDQQEGNVIQVKGQGLCGENPQNWHGQP